MEGISLRVPLDQQSISPHKSQIGNPRNIRHYHPSISMPHGKFPPPDSNTIGLSPAPSPFISHSCPPQAVYQPPLLPLPAAANKKPLKGGRTRDPSLTPKRSKFRRKEAEISATSSEAGPDPNTVNKPRFVSSSAKYEPDDVFSGSVVFATSPHPSSLPLPTFTLGPKLAVCRAEAAATDDLRRLLRLL